MKTTFKILTLLLSVILVSCSKEDDSVIRDADGNVYTSVQIGTQVWMVENLKTTKLNNNTQIPLVTENGLWASLTTPGYCWNENDVSNKVTYGALYNYQAVNTNKLCPSGWHVPGNSEWTVLVTYLGGEIIAGGKLKESGYLHWEIPNMGATNESGFTARPGGFRYGQGSFDQPGIESFFWSSAESGPANVHILKLSSGNSDAVVGFISKDYGCSVRCIKDN